MTKSSIEEIMDFVKEDGKTHIRVDLRANTTLGKVLDPQYVSPFYHPYLGNFVTTEGFWYYISSKEPDELFRVLNGHECRKHLKSLRAEGKIERVHCKNFFQQIFFANYLKIKTDPKILDLFTNFKTDLPFEIYHLENKDNKTVLRRTNSYDVRVRNLTMLRSLLISNINSEVWIPDSKDILERMSDSVKVSQGLIK